MSTKICSYLERFFSSCWKGSVSDPNTSQLAYKSGYYIITPTHCLSTSCLFPSFLFCTSHSLLMSNSESDVTILLWITIENKFLFKPVQMISLLKKVVQKAELICRSDFIRFDLKKNKKNSKGNFYSLSELLALQCINTVICTVHATYTWFMNGCRYDMSIYCVCCK